MDELLQISPYQSDGGELIGRNPLDVTANEYSAHLPGAKVGLKAIRAKCLDCCAGQEAEVRKCVATSCPLWPLRMGKTPSGLQAARGFERKQKGSQ